MKIIYQREVGNTVYFATSTQGGIAIYEQTGDEEESRLICGAHNEKDAQKVIDKIIVSISTVKADVERIQAELSKKKRKK